jgi:hypothetical protein
MSTASDTTHKRHGQPDVLAAQAHAHDVHVLRPERHDGRKAQQETCAEGRGEGEGVEGHGRRAFGRSISNKWDEDASIDHGGIHIKLK